MTCCVRIASSGDFQRDLVLSSLEGNPSQEQPSGKTALCHMRNSELKKSCDGAVNWQEMMLVIKDSPLTQRSILRTCLFHVSLLHFRRFHEEAIRLNGNCENAKNVDLVRQGDFACFMEGLTGQKVISDDFSQTGACNFYVTTEKNIATLSYAMAFPVSKFSWQNLEDFFKTFTDQIPCYKFLVAVIVLATLVWSA